MRGALTRRTALGAAAVLIVAACAVTWRTHRAVQRMRPWAGEGVVAGKVEGRPVTLRMTDGSELPVQGIASRIDVGDRVVKRSGEIAYEVNGARVSPLPTLLGQLLFFWLFLPAVAIAPAIILQRTKE